MTKPGGLRRKPPHKHRRVALLLQVFGRSIEIEIERTGLVVI